MNTAPRLYSIKASTVSKSFGAVRALDSLSIDFQAETMHGVIGPEGAGKTTLLRTLVGLLHPHAGKIEYLEDGKTVEFASIRSDVAYMPQTQSLYPDLSIDEHLQFFRDLYRIDEREYQAKREELLEITRLAPFVDRAAGKLSGGMYKKLGLMCALLRSPRVMLLDEPTNGVDPISRREFWDLLYRLRDQKILIIITTAYMDEAERCALVHVIEKGHLLAEGEPKDILEKEGVRSFDELFLKRGSVEANAR